VERIVWQILVSILGFFLTTEEFLLSCLEILTNSKSCRSENNFIVALSEMKSILVPVAGKAINVIDFVGDRRL